MASICAVTLLAAMAGARSGASISVTATVAPYLRSSVTALANKIHVSEADIRAGYIEAGGVRVDVRTNDPRGYLLLFRLGSGPFESVLITGLPRDLEVGSAGAFVTEQGTMIPLTKVLRYRLRLSPKAKQGDYAVPVTVTVHQLGRNP